MIKRLLCFALAILLIGGASLSACAENKNLLLTDGSANYYAFTSVCGVGETLYVYGSGVLKSYTIGDKDFITVETLAGLTPPDGGEDAYVTRLFSDGNCLYGLAQATGDVWLLVDEEGRYEPRYRLRLDLSASVGSEGYPDFAIVDAVATQNALCLYGSLELSDSGDTLMIWSLETGAPMQTIANVLSVALYDDTRILILTRDDEETAISQILTLEPESGAMEPVASSDMPIVTDALYCKENASLCIFAYNEAYTLDGTGKPVLAAYLPWQLGGSVCAGMLGERHIYIADDWHGVAVRELNSEGATQGALVVMNGPEVGQHNAYLRQHPEVNVTLTDDALYSYEDLTNQLFMKTAGFDLLGIDLESIPFEKLVRKGYLAEITAPALLAIAEKMEPSIIEACTEDGRLYAMPMRYDGHYLLCYNKSAAEALGLEKLPSSFMELLDMIESWPEAYGEEYPDFVPMADNYLQETLYWMLYEQYVAYMRRGDQPLTFDTPLFRTLIERVSAIDFHALGQDLGLPSDDLWNKTALFDTSMLANLGAEDSTDRRLILPLEAGLEQVYPMSLRVMTVNAASSRTDESMDYLLTMAQNYAPAQEAVRFFPEHIQSVEREGWAESLELCDASLAHWKDELPTAENSAELRERIENLEQYRKNIYANRYLITSEAIAAYRQQVAPYQMFAAYLPADEDCRNLIWRFMDGGMSVDSLIAEMSNRVRLAQLEE